MYEEVLQRQVFNWLQRDTLKSGVRRVSYVNGVVASDIGQARLENQDKACIAVLHDCGGNSVVLGIVSDGMGGMHAGANCASITLSSIIKHVVTSLRNNSIDFLSVLRDAVAYANNEVFRNFRAEGGATVSCVMYLQNGTRYWANAGDSRIYINSHDKFEAITVDDTIAGQLKKEGSVPSEHLKLLQYVGMGKNFEVHSGIISETSDTAIAIMSDGIHYLTNFGTLLRRVSQSTEDLGIVAKRLLDVANWAGGADNASIIMLNGEVPIRARKSDFSEVLIWDAFGEITLSILDTASNLKGSSNFQEATQSVHQPQNVKVPPKKKRNYTKKSKTTDTSIADKSKNKEEPIDLQIDIKFQEKS